MQCVVCDGVDDTVVEVATCTNRCVVTSHAECFLRRRSTPRWKGKHYCRKNETSEVCLVVGCLGKCRTKVSHAREKPSDGATGRIRAPHIDGTMLDDPERPCCFLGRDGLPCRRPAVSNGACTRHAREAEVMCNMVEKAETRADETTAKVTVGTQTTERADALERLRAGFERTAQRDARHIARLEIDLENEREERDAERATFRRQADENTETIARLLSEVDRLREDLRTRSETSRRLATEVGERMQLLLRIA